MGIARVPIPERVPDAVAALDLNHCALRPVAPALASGLEVDLADADRCGLAFFATHPQVRAQVGHVGRGPSRIKKGASCRKPLVVQ